MEDSMAGQQDGDHRRIGGEGSLDLLAGVNVLDLSTYVLGPYAAMMLGDMGADVIKVEPPGGDPNRRIGRRSGGTGVLFAATNHGKRSIVLDLKDADDAAVLRSLLRWADVLVENWRPGVADRLGLGDETLVALNERLIHLNVTGWGTTGPWQHRAAFDGLVQAFSGLAWSATTQGRPSLLRLYATDKIAGVFGVQAVLGALVRTARTGRGGRLDVNMVDAAAYFNFPDTFTERFLASDVATVDPELAPATKLLVRASDGYLVVSPGTGSQIKALCEALGRPEWLVEFRAATSLEELSPLLGARVESVTPTGTVDHWVELLAAHDVPVAPVLDLDQHLAHPQVAANRTYGESDHPGFGSHRVAYFPVHAAGQDLRDASAGTFPDLDEHAQAIRALAVQFRRTPGVSADGTGFS